MSSTRAPAVAEILWELKRLDKVAKFTTIATRAGFSPGANGRAMLTCLEAIRKEWPHLQYWRAIRDDNTVVKGSSQSTELVAWGATLNNTVSEEDRVGVLIEDTRLMSWDAVAGANT